MANGNSSRFPSSKMQDLPKLEMDHHFAEVHLLAENSGAKVFVAERLDSDSSVILKCVRKETTKKKDFCREFYYSLSLSPHPNIITCFDEVFEASNSYVFTQEFAPAGDMSKHLKHYVKEGDKTEIRAKRVAEQIAFALEFMHIKNLVHRDVCLENIFVFDNEMSRVKLGDFGNTEREGTLVKKLKVRSPWAPPEVSLAVYNEGYYVHSGQDAWQLGILIFVCLTGSYPWSSADITDRHYKSWVAWLKRKTTKTPPRFRCFTPRLLRLLRRLLEPSPERRYGVRELQKYLSDPWLMSYTNTIGSDALKGSSELSVSKRSFLSQTGNKLTEILRSYINYHYSRRDQESKVSGSCVVSGCATAREEAPK